MFTEALHSNLVMELTCAHQQKNRKGKYDLYTQWNVPIMKKDEGMSFAKISIHLEIIILRQLHQSQKDKDHMFSLTCGSYI